MKKVLFSFLLLTFSVTAYQPAPFTEEQSPPESFFYFMMGMSSHVDQILWGVPEFSFGRRSLNVRHGWDYSIGTRMRAYWEEVYAQASYNFHPFNGGTFIGFGGRYGGFHVKNMSELATFNTAEVGIVNRYGFFSQFSANLGYEFQEEIPGFVQFQVTTNKELSLSYGFGF